MISTQARRGAEPSRIVRLLAYEAALRDVAGTTAQHIALSLGRLNPAPQPSFATSPRIGATRRISAPGEDAVGIWQMAPTSGGATAPASRPPAASPSASDGAMGHWEHACAPLCMGSRAQGPDQLQGDDERSGQSGELTAQAVSMHDVLAHDDLAASGATSKASDAAEGAASNHAGQAGPLGGLMRDEWDAMEAEVEVEGADDGGDWAGCAGACAADACVRMQRFAAARAALPEGRLAAAAPLRTGTLPAPRRRTTADSACSRDYGSGSWWKVPVDTHVEVPADDGIRVGAEGAAFSRPRGRRVRRAARCAVAGVAVVAVRLLFGKRRNAQ